MVYDAFSLLESVSGSFEGEPDSQEGREMQYATKVAAHALRPVLDEVNTVERECSYITIPGVPDELGREVGLYVRTNHTCGDAND